VTLGFAAVWPRGEGRAPYLVAFTQHLAKVAPCIAAGLRPQA
jgi:hypothetical protein